MIEPADMHRCCVCGAIAVVIVQLPEATVCYCSHDWLAVELDGLTPDAVICWVHDARAAFAVPAAG